jgi:hypothetical protein
MSRCAPPNQSLALSSMLAREWRPYDDHTFSRSFAWPVSGVGRAFRHAQSGKVGVCTRVDGDVLIVERKGRLFRWPLKKTTETCLPHQPIRGYSVDRIWVDEINTWKGVS